MLYHQNAMDCVRYYFLPARKGNSAEIIEVLNSKRYTVDVPMWEEDVVLEPFHARLMTPKEVQACKGSEAWKLFPSWSKLYKDHQKYGVEEYELKLLENYRSQLLLSDSMIA